jgi:hypothetical protein
VPLVHRAGVIRCEILFTLRLEDATGDFYAAVYRSDVDPLMILRGHKLIFSLSKEGILTVKREMLREGDKESSGPADESRTPDPQ